MVKYILFVCKGNAARSQMAEGLFNYFNRNLNYEAISAGIKPANKISIDAINVMAEIGISISKNVPKKITSEMINKSERIITLGCSIKKNSKKIKAEDWPLEDLKGAPKAKFLEVRDELEKRIIALIKKLI
jgi:arsenate reductase